MQITVLKFGSSVLRDAGDLPRAVHEIYRHLRDGRRVVAVVSAIGDTTERLLQAAEEFEGGERHVAALLATGEEEATALLALAAEQAGIPTARLDGPGLGIVTVGERLDAQPLTVDVSRLRAKLEDARLLVVPGFIGVDAQGERTLLGRGGSDFSALFLAHHLAAERCLLLKDVDGLYASDPNAPGPDPVRYARVSFGRALELAGSVLQPKGVQFATKAELAFEVGSVSGPETTCVDHGPEELAMASFAARPRLRVALLGCGAVGGGVFARLANLPELFEVASVLVRDPAKHPEIPPELLTTDMDDFGDVDVVVELLGGTDSARSCVERALERGLDVVTANKALVANAGLDLAQLASTSGARFLYSAAVGGSLPAIEVVREVARRAPIEEVAGVLNGTANFVLGEVALGTSLDDAVERARELGFAEADPTRDLDGSDVADKLEILAIEAFGPDVTIEWAERSGLERLTQPSPNLRLVGEVRREGTSAVCRVSLRSLPQGHRFLQAAGAGNVLRVRTRMGDAIQVHGAGAGRWPTAESVVADLLSLTRVYARVPLSQGGAA